MSSSLEPAQFTLAPSQGIRTSPSRRMAVDDTLRVFDGDPALVPSQVLQQRRAAKLSASKRASKPKTRRTSRDCRASCRAAPLAHAAIRWRSMASSGWSSSGRDEVWRESCAAPLQVQKMQQCQALSSCLLSWTCEAESASREGEDRRLRHAGLGQLSDPTRSTLLRYHQIKIRPVKETFAE